MSVQVSRRCRSSGRTINVLRAPAIDDRGRVPIPGNAESGFSGFAGLKRSAILQLVRCLAMVNVGGKKVVWGHDGRNIRREHYGVRRRSPRRMEHALQILASTSGARELLVALSLRLHAITAGRRCAGR